LPFQPCETTIDCLLPNQTSAYISAPGLPIILCAGAPKFLDGNDDGLGRKSCKLANPAFTQNLSPKGGNFNPKATELAVSTTKSAASPTGTGFPARPPGRLLQMGSLEELEPGVPENRPRPGRIKSLRKLRAACAAVAQPRRVTPRNGPRGKHWGRLWPEVVIMPGEKVLVHRGSRDKNPARSTLLGRAFAPGFLWPWGWMPKIENASQGAKTLSVAARALFAERPHSDGAANLSPRRGRPIAQLR